MIQVQTQNTLPTFKLAMLLSLCVLGLNGCFLVPVIDSVRQVGITESDRQRLLGEKMKDFREALMWGEPTRAVPLLLSDNYAQLEAYLRKVARTERVIESKVDSVSFSESSFEADAEVTVRSYKVPFYVVHDRSEKQVWKFSLTSGWKLFSLVELPDSIRQGNNG